MEQNETAVKQALRAYLHAGIQGYAVHDSELCQKQGLEQSSKEPFGHADKYGYASLRRN
jgi:hypothetical protein